MLTGILVKKMYNKRSFDRSREEVNKIKGEHTEVNFPSSGSSSTKLTCSPRQATPNPAPIP
jgi:hypothetical protein